MPGGHDAPIELSDSDETDDETGRLSTLVSAAARRQNKRGASSTLTATIDLTADIDVAMTSPSRKAPKIKGASSSTAGPPYAVIDLCDDDGLLEVDSGDADFARQFQQSFDEVEIVGEKWAAAPVPRTVSRCMTEQTHLAVTAASDLGSSSSSSQDEAVAPNTENDETFAARLQAQVDEEIRQEGERRKQIAGEDEEFARTLQACPPSPPSLVSRLPCPPARSAHMPYSLRTDRGRRG